MGRLRYNVRWFILEFHNFQINLLVTWFVDVSYVTSREMDTKMT